VIGLDEKDLRKTLASCGRFTESAEKDVKEIMKQGVPAYLL